MHIIVYISEYSGSKALIHDDLIGIIEESQRNNSDARITGLLFYHDQHFLQIIEAQQQTLENLMTVLEADQRHKNIQRVVDEPISKRSFSDWNMASFNLSNDVPLDPEEIKRITKLFKKNVNLSASGGGLLVKFYQAMLTKSS